MTMFEAFGERAGKVIKDAEEEARAMGHKLVGTEHLLLAIIAEDDCFPSKVLKKYGYTADAVRQEILSLAGWGDKLDFGGGLIFDPSTKRALEQALEEMASSGGESILVEHLFMGITFRTETVASVIIQKRGHLARCRDEVQRFVAEACREAHAGILDGEGRRTGRERVPASRDFLRPIEDRVLFLEERMNALSQALQSTRYRTGIGFDSHRFSPGRPLVLGGVTIPYSLGLLGHSDADVLVHAIIDALLGAMASGDIGSRFPDTDERYRDAESLRLLESTGEMASKEGFSIVHLDSIVITEKPRLAPHRASMAGNIARALSVPPEAVSVKAKTAEGMGFVGEGQGIAAFASVLVTFAGSR
ncbi:MAG: 2-C-methyl-D-erythritol 2,4-cyclodiphosphate synthase [Candidatus Eremiobacteraeota bacterium]|nr:2-C-methyl-D-erythritol 2,4-cyclodiphosphate synthase [Candidatus Eremiobacteraeota bacterium]